MIEVFKKYLEDVKYRDWDFNVQMDGERAYLQIGFWEYDSSLPLDVQNCKTYQKGRKWFLSPYMTKSEVVQTALKAVLTAEEHEARERFTYKGKCIFGPHFCIDRLAAVCNEDSFDKRKVVA
jgi:hypothetical protein